MVYALEKLTFTRVSRKGSFLAWILKGKIEFAKTEVFQTQGAARAKAWKYEVACHALRIACISAW